MGKTKKIGENEKNLESIGIYMKNLIRKEIGLETEIALNKGSVISDVDIPKVFQIDLQVGKTIDYDGKILISNQPLDKVSTEERNDALRIDSIINRGVNSLNKGYKPAMIISIDTSDMRFSSVQ